MEPVIGTGAEQRLSEFVEHVRERGVDGFASSVLRNRQTIPVDPTVLKAEVALRLGEIFVDRGIERYADVSPALSDEVRRDELVAGVRAVPGSTTSYAGGWLSRLVGDDDLVEPDPVLVQWIGRAIGRYVEPAEAEALLRAAAAQRGWPPAALTCAVQIAERLRPPVISSDSATARTYRALQGRWRREVLGLPPGDPTTPNPKLATVDSMLPRKHRGVHAADAGWNLMSPAAIEYARRRVPAVKAAKGVVEEDRLWRNMLSSQPLAFSIVGELRAHPAAALALLSEAAGVEVVGFDRIPASDPAYELDGLQAEWAPRPEEHTGDKSGFDIAAAVRIADGRRMLISIEVKYTDTFSPAKLDPMGYRPLLDEIGLADNATAELVKAGCSQFLRSVLLTHSVRRGGANRRAPLDSCLGVVLCRDDDKTAGKVVNLLGAAQPTVPVRLWGLGDFLDEAARRPELADWADTVHARYLLDDDVPT
jgi:hypothetical protein